MKFQATVFQLMVVFSLVLPALVALVTKKVASGPLKQIVLLFLSAVAAIGATLIAGTNYDLLETVVAILTQFFLGVIAFFGLDKVVYQPLSNKTANVGIGGPA